MREIKFRAWDKKERKMLIVTQIHFDIKKIASKEMPPVSIKSIELMQFTGLLDRHGKKIYEGDIVSVTNLPCQIQKAQLIGVVEFSWAAFELKIKRTIEWKSYNVDSPEFMLLSSIIGLKEMAVIGNRWENPELLEA